MMIYDDLKRKTVKAFAVFLSYLSNRKFTIEGFGLIYTFCKTHRKGCSNIFLYLNKFRSETYLKKRLSYSNSNSIPSYPSGSFSASESCGP